MCHQHEQDQSVSDADVEQMNTRALQSYSRVELQPVRHHPREDFIDADRQTLLQCVNIGRVTKPVDLSVICITVWMKTTRSAT